MIQRGLPYMMETKVSNIKIKGRLKVLQNYLNDGAHREQSESVIQDGQHMDHHRMSMQTSAFQQRGIYCCSQWIIETFETKKKNWRKGYELISETDTHKLGCSFTWIIMLKATVGGKSQRLCIVWKAPCSGIIFKDHLKNCSAVRKDSPLIVGHTENGISLHQMAVLKYTRDVYLLKMRRLSCMTDSTMEFHSGWRAIEKESIRIDWGNTQCRRKRWIWTFCAEGDVRNKAESDLDTFFAESKATLWLEELKTWRRDPCD